MNIVLIVCDTLRADHVGCYGYFRETSPAMDRLAEEGVLFENTFASGVCTGTAFTSIHTGLYPIHHKVYNVTPPDLILDEIPTLAEVLRAGGYTTIAFDSLAHNRCWSQDPVHYYRGFESYVSDISNPRDWNYSGERVRADCTQKRSSLPSSITGMFTNPTHNLSRTGIFFDTERGICPIWRSEMRRQATGTYPDGAQWVNYTKTTV